MAGDEMVCSQVKLPLQFDFLLVSFHTKIEPTQYQLQHSSSFVQMCYLVLMKSSDKLLN